MTSSVFISRYLENDSPLKRGLEKEGCLVTGVSLVQLTGMRYPGVPDCDWVFFSGKTAIRYFFAGTPKLPGGIRFGVMGRGSQLVLRKYGFEADFVGTGNDAVKIGDAFARQIDREKVLFAGALDAASTVQRRLPLTARWKNLYVYRNEPKKDFVVPHADLLVFTSPYNAVAYMSKYAIEEKQKVVAIGTTTKRELLRLGVTNVYLPKDFYERRLLERVLSLLKERPLYPGDMVTDRAA